MFHTPENVSKEYRNRKIYRTLFSYLKFPSLYLVFDLISLFNLIHYYKMKIKKSLYNFLTFLQHDTFFNGNDLKLRCISTPIV